jgi:thiol:disulfide interchange protein
VTNFLKALGLAALAYVGIFLAVILSPVVILLALWSGLCLFGAAFMFFFWLLLTHNPNTLHGALYLLAWGSPPCVAAGVLGYYRGQRRARRNAPHVSLRQDAQFR